MKPFAEGDRIICISADLRENDAVYTRVRLHTYPGPHTFDCYVHTEDGLDRCLADFIELIHYTRLAERVFR